MRFWPRGLAGQLMLVTALTLLVAQAVNLALLANAQRNQAAIATAAGAVVLINDALERIEDGDVPRQWTDVSIGPARPRLRGEDRMPRRVRRIIIADHPAMPPALRDWPEVVEQVERGLGSVGPGQAITEVRAQRGRVRPPPRRSDAPAVPRDRALDVAAVAVRMADGRWLTIRTRRPVQDVRIGALLVGQTLILFGLLLGPLLFLAWRVSRPLARLVTATTAVGQGGDRAMLPESGPADVRDLTRAFNAMRERIWSMLRDKDRMLGAIGHDLRTPLASLRVRVEQVEDFALRSKMVATIDDMTVMLGNILALARANQPQEAPQSTDMAAMLADIAGDYQAMDKAVTLAGEGAVVQLSIRPAAVRSAVRNLIDNALAYAGSAEVGLEREAEGRIAIIINDNGPGIAEDRIESMLEPFVRAEESRNRATGGAGLGLTLARAVALAEGGELCLTNREPTGLSARLILPGQT